VHVNTDTNNNNVSYQMQWCGVVRIARVDVSTSVDQCAHCRHVAQICRPVQHGLRAHNHNVEDQASLACFLALTALAARAPPLASSADSVSMSPVRTAVCALCAHSQVKLHAAHITPTRTSAAIATGAAYNTKIISHTSARTCARTSAVVAVGGVSVGALVSLRDARCFNAVTTTTQANVGPSSSLTPTNAAPACMVAESLRATSLLLSLPPGDACAKNSSAAIDSHFAASVDKARIGTRISARAR
jgi:hypothetical protein